MIEVAASVLKKVIAVNGLKNLERRIEIGATGIGCEVKMVLSKG